MGPKWGSCDLPKTALFGGKIIKSAGGLNKKALMMKSMKWGTETGWNDNDKNSDEEDIIRGKWRMRTQRTMWEDIRTTTTAELIKLL